MLHDLDETIKQVLITGVPLDTSEVDVAFEAPTSEWSARLARPTINCYLYQLVENHDLREQAWERERATARPHGGRGEQVTTMRRATLRIDCCYMVSAWAQEPEDEHLLLWRSLAALMRHPILPVSYLHGLLAEQSWPLLAKAAQPEAPIKNPSDFWSTMEGPIRPAFQYIVTLPLDSQWTLSAPLVLTRRLRTGMVGSSDAPAAPQVQIGGWVRRGGGNEVVPVPDAQVWLVERGRGARTDAEGRFAFDQVPVGRHTLRAITDGAQTERVVEVPGPEYDLLLAPSGASSAAEPPGEHRAPAGGGDA